MTDELGLYYVDGKWAYVDGLSLWTWPLTDVEKPSDHPFAPLPSRWLLYNR